MQSKIIHKSFNSVPGTLETVQEATEFQIFSDKYLIIYHVFQKFRTSQAVSPKCYQGNYPGVDKNGGVFKYRYLSTF